MIYIFVTAILLACVFGPSYWVKYNMWRYSKTIGDMPGTGGELAEHLLHRFGLEGFVVEETLPGQDHFDFTAKAVRLSPKNYSGKSLTAIAVAAHEVGHALQFFNHEKIFQLRQKYIPTALLFKKIGIIFITLAPVVALLLKVPALIVGCVLVSLLFQVLGSVLYLIVLPEEWDASFGKALPILIEGEYIGAAQVPPVKRVLKAAALTYFAAALADILNIGRWLLLLRR
ncbi:MAG: Zn-dependent membrane protease YugP [Lentisphaeria bacterium]|jgi:Zn-dependent membrane protease YugP